LPKTTQEQPGQKDRKNQDSVHEYSPAARIGKGFPVMAPERETQLRFPWLNAQWECHPDNWL
jgi:hypothetical protein